MLSTLELSCPAKVNLVLSVGQPDTSTLHPLTSWMVTVEFSDTLTLNRASAGAGRFDIQPAVHSGREAGGIKRPPVRVDWPVESDLTSRAVALLQDHVRRPLAVDLTLRKRIPAGAGLGGGSSNAAGTLIGLNRLFDLELDAQTLIDLGRRLGSDVGFLVAAMLGCGSALVTGVGDRIEPMAVSDPIDLVLVFPPFGCSTASVYAAFDRLEPRDEPVDPQQIRRLAAQRPLAPGSLSNDLAPAAFAVAPQLEQIVDRLEQRLAQPVHVTGSGSTLFLIAPSPPAASALATEVTQHTDLPAVATRTACPS